MRSRVRNQLLAAIAAGDQQEVEFIVDKRPDLVDSADSHGNTPLRKAVHAGHEEVVRLLLARGADPLQRNQAGAGLMDAAVRAGSEPIVTMLSSAGCALEPHHAAERGELDVLERMAAEDPSCLERCDHRGGSALHAAARGSRIEVIEWLLQRGADPSCVDRLGVTPLGEAVEVDALAAATTLLEGGANPNGGAGHQGGTALHRAIQRKLPAMVELLLDRGADPELRDVAGKTALHQAAVADHGPILELVLSRRPNLDAVTRKTPKSPYAETALEYAQRTKKVHVAERLEGARLGQG